MLTYSYYDEPEYHSLTGTRIAALALMGSAVFMLWLISRALQMIGAL